MDKLMEKGLTVAISLGAGFVASKAFDLTWKQVTGEEPPKNDEIDAVDIKRALVFGVTSAAVSAAVQVLSQRGAKAGMNRLKNNRSEV
ncbi:DUF4235 domain-containing protein [Nesterenkonia sp. MY13]|uniref:DUF4235 domain-containing protein n=1 Tax=Nesterenkonia sedimenti TaxID=1463632 RepID=A0A7X8TJR9_9MICC|nr:DUF4235 domain-containing protein [Nesterenkonia sedimenti]NLS09373.1 DUF4235 domain-containing protein [Nesterenkonia sedimenti]